MSAEFILDAVVPFADVDREQVMLLSRVGKLLQEAAIQHADMYGVGARDIAERGTSWVLNRLAVEILRYPRRDEPVRVQTWSTGVRGFKGFREFRVWSGEELVITGTSLWLWIDLRTRMLTRVPQELASLFPVGAGSPPYRPDIEKLRFAAPAEEAPTVPVSVRYSDFDANGHVNNTAFFDFLQTALVQSGRGAHPRRLELQFQREIPTGTTAVSVRLAPGEAGTVFAICGAEGSYAQGIVA